MKLIKTKIDGQCIGKVRPLKMACDIYPILRRNNFYTFTSEYKSIFKNETVIYISEFGEWFRKDLFEIFYVNQYSCFTSKILR